MARANLNKSENFVTNTTVASKYTPKRTRICINWNRPIQTLLRIIFKNHFSEIGLKGRISIDADSGSLRGMFFDAAIVFVKNFSLRLGPAILC